MSEKNNACDTAPALLFSCCGVADVGEIADLAARKLHKEGTGKMYCLTGVGTGLSGFIESTKAAAKVVVIDGCPIDCAKKLLEKNGITGFEWFRVTDKGFTKGASPVTEEAVQKVVADARKLMCA